MVPSIAMKNSLTDVDYHKLADYCSREISIQNLTQQYICELFVFELIERVKRDLLDHGSAAIALYEHWQINSARVLVDLFKTLNYRATIAANEQGDCVLKVRLEVEPIIKGGAQ